ncbi:helix-turn-helix protein [Lentzea atacamensis]|uniref:Helix-turn-helix protein n=1 Tax=Lentzea atacamensis TaxID=531938 RepID=A0A316HLN6_9PSEU|nr:helix-turn-helix transcriptional regulator [Lentzea atacamensis]PWK81120.1 helix-turn-helix protein [Lentzea atacamensis]
MPESSEQRRHELGVFLRSRRARLTPAEVGLSDTRRRRTPGLRREELALLAGMSATWYTYLEQGRDVQASDQVLGALASALRLGRSERDHLFRLAGRTAAVYVDQPLPPEVAGVPTLLQPHPAYIIDGSYDVLSHNQAAAELFPNLTVTRDRPNFARWVFAEPVARHVLVDWEPEARALLARLRTFADRHATDPRFTRLIEDLHDASPEVRTWWPQYDVQVRHSGRKRLRHPDLGEIDYAYTAFHLAEQPDHAGDLFRSAVNSNADAASRMSRTG